MDTGDQTVGVATIGAPRPDDSRSSGPARDEPDPALTLRVNEVFGPTVQGEGPATGQHCLFVRLALCNLRCTWCDTAYTWAFTEDLAAHLRTPQVFDRADNDREMTIPAVLDALRGSWPIDTRPTVVVVSGGEPMMQQRPLAELARNLQQRDHSVHVETAGTIAPLPDLVDQVDLFVVSPKLAHSGNPRQKRIRPAVLSAFGALGSGAMFKFVVTEPLDLVEVDEIVAGVGIPDRQVMIMPEGTTTAALLDTGRLVADAVTARGWGLCLRTHILLWSDVRGR